MWTEAYRDPLTRPNLDRAVPASGPAISVRTYPCDHAKRLDSRRPRARSPHDTARGPRTAGAL
ncbi:hypothetical protein SBD_1121 [Streptomyces bottropensis ATCC 25435]|uniref:Uncharacterized protein n=1 Tax=Streptomyces bottropensis ATCC 25435 TaxID=1054862 RepID=M3DN83_9ACTN|nr:hypothetical protein SBD_1121 [Streptomyces bottropensis ATCC 25435]